MALRNADAAGMTAPYLFLSAAWLDQEHNIADIGMPSQAGSFGWRGLAHNGSTGTAGTVMD